MPVRFNSTDRWPAVLIPLALVGGFVGELAGQSATVALSGVALGYTFGRMRKP